MKIPHTMTWAFWAHEPIQFYRRRHADIHSILGTGRWTEAWYDRIHTEEAISKAAEIGVNLIYTHFYKGFGLEFEKEEMERTAEVVRIGHKYGMTVLGYCTPGTFYAETLAEEFENPLEASRIDASGKPYHPGFEGGFPSRNFTCYNSSRYFDEYFPKIIEHGLKVTGLDGFHFDNATSELPCHCATCLAAFRKYLQDHAGDPKRYALGSWNHVGFPAAHGPLEPIKVQWLRYCRDLCTELHSKLFRKVKELDPEAIVLYNPGLGRFTPNGYEPLDAPAEADMAFIETPSVIRWEKETNQHITAVPSYKLAELTHKKALNTSWLSNEHSLRTPENQEEINRLVAEHMVFGRDCGSNWLCRPMKKGSAMLMDTPLHHDALKKAFTYFKEHPELYVDTTPVSKVKILYSTVTRLLLAEEHHKGVLKVAELLRAKGLPWSYITPDSPAPGADETVIIPNCLALSDADGEKLAQWPCKILSLSTAGILDEDGIEREEPLYPPADLSQITAGFQSPMEHALFETARAGDGSLLVHVINIDNEFTRAETAITLPFRAESCQAFSFEDNVSAELAAPYKVIVKNLKTLCTLKFTLLGEY